MHPRETERNLSFWGCLNLLNTEVSSFIHFPANDKILFACFSYCVCTCMSLHSCTCEGHSESSCHSPLDQVASELLGPACLCPPTLGLQVTMPCLHMGAGDFISGPHACPASALPTDPSPQLKFVLYGWMMLLFKKYICHTFFIHTPIDGYLGWVRSM